MTQKTHKQNFGTHPVPGQSRKFVYVYVLLLSLTLVGYTKLHVPDGGGGNVGGKISTSLLTLPAALKTFVLSFANLVEDLALKNGGDFAEGSVVSVSRAATKY